MMEKIANRRARSRDDNRNKGFSLVELIIVIAIMAVLTTILAPQLLRYVERSREAKDKQHIAELLRVFEIACVDYGSEAEYKDGMEMIYARHGGGATYQINGKFGSINPSLMAMMVRFYGPNTNTGGDKGTHYIMPPLTSRKFRSYNSGKGVSFKFVMLNEDGTTTDIGGSGTSGGAMLTVKYTGPSLT